MSFFIGWSAGKAAGNSDWMGRLLDPVFDFVFGIGVRLSDFIEKKLEGRNG